MPLDRPFPMAKIVRQAEHLSSAVETQSQHWAGLSYCSHRRGEESRAPKSSLTNSIRALSDINHSSSGDVD